jgi:propanol-preferring alcohol dehydrogenase
MRAWILDQQTAIEERPLRLVELVKPDPAPGELRIKVLTCGVCRTDIHIAEGDLPLKKENTVLGHEVVGVVDQLGKGVRGFELAEKVGACWLHSSCNQCKYCLTGRENYCSQINCTGWDRNGGFAEYMTIPHRNALSLEQLHWSPDKLAPLLCPGIAGYAAFKLADVAAGDKLGLYGFGPTAYFVLKVAQAIGLKSFVSTRAETHIRQAKREGADWVGDTSKKTMPAQLDAAILFPPAGDFVEPILKQLRPGGTLVMAPVSSTPITIQNYSSYLWGRSIRTLYNVNKTDATEFIRLAENLDSRPATVVFPFESLPQALIQAKQGSLASPNAVLQVASDVGEWTREAEDSR